YNASNCGLFLLFLVYYINCNNLQEIPLMKFPWQSEAPALRTLDKITPVDERNRLLTAEASLHPGNAPIAIGGGNLQGIGARGSGFCAHKSATSKEQKKRQNTNGLKSHERGSHH
ncbi:MAG: hypothetical protein ACYTGH_03280, partial [Planctomycetota bacterium]